MAMPVVHSHVPMPSPHRGTAVEGLSIVCRQVAVVIVIMCWPSVSFAAVVVVVVVAVLRVVCFVVPLSSLSWCRLCLGLCRRFGRLRRRCRRRRPSARVVSFAVVAAVVVPLPQPPSPCPCGCGGGGCEGASLSSLSVRAAVACCRCLLCRLSSLSSLSRYVIILLFVTSIRAIYIHFPPLLSPLVLSRPRSRFPPVSLPPSRPRARHRAPAPLFSAPPPPRPLRRPPRCGGHCLQCPPTATRPYDVYYFSDFIGDCGTAAGPGPSRRPPPALTVPGRLSCAAAVAPARRARRRPSVRGAALAALPAPRRARRRLPGGLRGAPRAAAECASAVPRRAQS